MKTYRVGGCVRDRLLNLPIKDRDWVVVGANPEEMLKQGFKPIGKDFPVFLHPKTKEEYALARTERKTGPGYTGFEFHASAEITLDEDLQRRDLTINALAETESGEIIDPYNGQQDLHDRILRHVAPAFAEDPVRILRVARFAARYAELGFTIADETMSLMQDMVKQGEVDALVPERVWQEMQKALSEKTPARFIEVLRECGALKKLLPEVDCLFGIPQPEKYHPEIDTGVHVLLVMAQAARLTNDTRVRFAALMHDLGKGITPKEELPQHIEHESRGVPLVKNVCKRFRIPNDYRDLAVLVTKYHLYPHLAKELRPETKLKLFESLDAFRRPERFELFLLACEADSRGRPGYEDRILEKPEILRRALVAANTVDAAKLAQQGLSGPEIAKALHKQRIAAIQDSH